jgi:hypothetical protein
VALPRMTTRLLHQSNMPPTPNQSRLGFAADNVLFFGTGGLAYGHVDADGKVVLNDVDLWDSGQSQTNWGWTIGGGLEYELITSLLAPSICTSIVGNPDAAGGRRSRSRYVS